MFWKATRRGFTFIESITSIAVFAILVVSISQVTSTIIQQTQDFRENTAVSSLANRYLEIARNLPYSQIGTINGNPHGTLADLPNAIETVVNDTSYQIYYVVNYFDDPADGTILSGTDLAPNDYKQIKLYVKNVTTDTTQSFLTNIAPKGLESLSGGGALAIEVFDAVGQPVPNASINITNTSVNPNINVTRTTDSSGNWIEVGLPASANSYHIIVTKNGYSTDQTHAITIGNPNPTKSDATILDGQVTSISFSIDKVSRLLFNTFNQSCGAISGINLAVRGAKLIGTPDIYKFEHSYVSDAYGNVDIASIEWDNYVPAISSNDYMIYGSSPIQQISVLPNTDQTYTFVLGPKTTNSLLVIVKDGATGNPLKGVKVDLGQQGGGNILSKFTSGSIWSQQDWTGGMNQVTFTDASMYFSDDGNVDTSDTPSGIKLANYGGTSYASAGTLTSSTFDTGTNNTTYTSLDWQPTSQDPATEIKFQIATNNDSETWDYVGPDGTNATYFTVPGSTVHASNNNKRYVRYKAFLSTSNTALTPIVTSVGINYVSGCSTPGQAMFEGLENRSDYEITASMENYQTQIINPASINGYQTTEILLNP